MWRTVVAWLCVGLLVSCSGTNLQEGALVKKASLPAPLTRSHNSFDGAPQRQFRGDLVTADAQGNALSRAEYFDGTEWEQRLGVQGQGVAAGDIADTVSLNFVDVSIREVLDVILTQTLKKNFFLDARVQGKVTVRTSLPIQRSALLPMLENILALNSAAIVEAQGVLNIVPVSAVPVLSKQIVVDPSDAALRPGIGVYLFPVRYASVESVAELITTQVSSGNDLKVDTGRNILIYTGSSVEASVIADLVDVLDVDELRGMSFALFPLRSADPDEVAGELRSLLSSSGLNGVGKAIDVVAVKRMNGILVIAQQPSHLRQIAAWVRKLDKSNARTGSRVYVYYARNTRAKDLVEVLSEVFEADSLPQAAESSLSVAQQGDTSAELGSAPTVADAGRTVNTSDERIRIVADAKRNALVIVATAKQFELVEATLSRIDIPPLQVMIEATIAEVTLTDQLSYGLQWAFNHGNVGASLISGAGPSPAETFPGFNLAYRTPNAQVVLSALADVTEVKVVSSPQVMVLDNETARLQVGDTVPISTQTQQSSTNAGAPIVNTIEYFDTGVVLEVTPHVNASGQVTMEIAQQVSDAVATSTSGLNSPTINQRSFQSTVSVASGSTVALGGLIRDAASESESGIPHMRKIPVLGNLFKSKRNKYDRKELIVLITPRVVRNPHQAQAVTAELRSRLRGINDLGTSY
ncbi:MULTISPECIES: type II secretion system secretin GspD [unclassified Marinovum]